MVFLTPAAGDPFSLYVQDEVNRAQGFTVNYQQLVKKKSSAPMFLYLLMTFAKIFLKKAHLEVAREPIPTRQ